MGRPSKKTPEVVEEILRRLSQGEPLAGICKDAHMPHYANVWRWMEDDAIFRDAFTRARELGTHHIADDCIAIADNPALEPHDKRVRIDTRLRLLGKWNRSTYGERTLVGSDPDNPLPAAVVTLDPAKLSTEALREIMQARGEGENTG